MSQQLIFYPHTGDLESSQISERLEKLLEGAEQFKALVLDSKGEHERCTIPREMKYAYNWDELARLMRDLRELPEANQAQRVTKSDNLLKLSEVYEVLRGAKMPKLEAVRLALVNEANQLRGSASSVA